MGWGSKWQWEGSDWVFEGFGFGLGVRFLAGGHDWVHGGSDWVTGGQFGFVCFTAFLKVHSTLKHCPWWEGSDWVWGFKLDFLGLRVSNFSRLLTLVVSRILASSWVTCFLFFFFSLTLEILWLCIYGMCKLTFGTVFFTVSFGSQLHPELRVQNTALSWLSFFMSCSAWSCPPFTRHGPVSASFFFLARLRPLAVCWMCLFSPGHAALLRGAMRGRGQYSRTSQGARRAYKNLS